MDLTAASRLQNAAGRGALGSDRVFWAVKARSIKEAARRDGRADVVGARACEQHSACSGTLDFEPHVGWSFKLASAVDTARDEVVIDWAFGVIARLIRKQSSTVGCARCAGVRVQDSALASAVGEAARIRASAGVGARSVGGEAALCLAVDDKLVAQKVVDALARGQAARSTVALVVLRAWPVEDGSALARLLDDPQEWRLAQACSVDAARKDVLVGVFAVRVEAAAALKVLSTLGLALFDDKRVERPFVDALRVGAARHGRDGGAVDLVALCARNTDAIPESVSQSVSSMSCAHINI